MTYCEACDLPSDQCAHAVKEEKVQATSEPFSAQYSGDCGMCPDPIRLGETIVGSVHGFVHARHSYRPTL